MSTRKKFTDEQLEFILSQIPPPPGVGSAAIEFSHRQNLKVLRKHLSTVTMVINDESLRIFAQRCAEQVRKAYVVPHTPMGIILGQTIGEDSTQTSLHAKRTAGAKSDESDTSRLTSLLSGSSSTKNTTSYILFKDIEKSKDDPDYILHIGTKEDMLYFRSILEEVKVSDLVDSEEKHILDHDDLVEKGIIDWIPTFSRVFPKREVNLDKFSKKYALEIKLNKYTLFTHRITMEDVARSIESMNGSKPVVACLWKSQSDGYIYVFVNSSEIKNVEIPTMNVEAAFLDHMIQQKLDSFQVKGLKGITNAGLVFCPIKNIVLNIEKDKDKYKLYTNYILRRLSGVSILDLLTELRKVDDDAEFIEGEKEYDDMYFSFTYRGNVNEYLKDKGFYYLYVSGWNIDELVWMEEVDVYRLIITNAHLMAENFGIDASKQYMTNEILGRLFQGPISSKKNTAHFSTHFNSLTRYGFVSKISVAGLDKNDATPFTQSTHAQGYTILATAAIQGDVSNVTGYSERTFAGIPPQVGTGSVKIVKNITGAEEKTTPSVKTKLLQMLRKNEEKPYHYWYMMAKFNRTYSNRFSAQQLIFINSIMEQIFILDNEGLLQVDIGEKRKSIDRVREEFQKEQDIDAGFFDQILNFIDSEKNYKESINFDPITSKYGELEIPINVANTSTARADYILSITFKNTYPLYLPRRFIEKIAKEGYINWAFNGSTFYKPNRSGYPKKYTSLFPIEQSCLGKPYTSAFEDTYWFIAPPNFSPYYTIYLSMVFKLMKQRELNILILISYKLNLQAYSDFKINMITIDNKSGGLNYIREPGARERNKYYLYRISTSRLENPHIDRFLEQAADALINPRKPPPKAPMTPYVPYPRVPEKSKEREKEEIKAFPPDYGDIETLRSLQDRSNAEVDY